MGFGPPRDGKHTFHRLDDNPRWQGIPDLDEAGPIAVEAYFRAYGPATHDHVHYWLGSGLSAGRKRINHWLSALGERLVPVDLEGTAAYVLREDVDGLMAARPSVAVRLLPGHDPWVLGPGTKDEHVTPTDRREPVTRKANLVVVGGVVSGTWKIRSDDLAVTWLDRAAPPGDAIEAEVTRLAAIVGRPLTWSVEPGS
jgi:hypothetical protein